MSERSLQLDNLEQIAREAKSLAEIVLEGSSPAAQARDLLSRITTHEAIHAEPEANYDLRWLGLAELRVEDLERCPHCGFVGEYWLREVGTKPSWQPFSLIVHPKEGLIAAVYDHWQVGDDCEVEHFECRECLFPWPDLEAVGRALVAAKHARDDAAVMAADAIEGDWDPERLGYALAVFVTSPGLRGLLEANDPKALEQARAALLLAQS